jgi:hypothetical protein
VHHSKLGRLTSAVGHERRVRTVCNISAFTPRSRRRSGHRFAPLGAKSGCEQLQQGSPYSITSSARPSNGSGTVRPNALAVFRFITNSYLVGVCTGRLAGFSPLRMRLT